MPKYKTYKTPKSDLIGLLKETQASEVIPKQTSVKLKVLDAKEQQADAMVEKAKATKVITKDQVAEMLERREDRREERRREAQRQTWEYRDTLKDRYIDNLTRISQIDDPSNPFQQLLERENQELLEELSR